MVGWMEPPVTEIMAGVRMGPGPGPGWVWTQETRGTCYVMLEGATPTAPTPPLLSAGGSPRLRGHTGQPRGSPGRVHLSFKESHAGVCSSLGFFQVTHPHIPGACPEF
jgi:hypothetical protein